MKKSVIACALLAIGVWSAGPLAQPRQPPPVTVTLVNNQIPDVAPVVVERDMGRNVVIRWQLPPGVDYRFDPTGIVINGELTPTGLKPQKDQLPNACTSGSPNHVTCINRNTRRPATFKYTIRLLDRNQRLVEKDPLIVNQ